jgi:hypothetical protein
VSYVSCSVSLQPVRHERKERRLIMSSKSVLPKLTANSTSAQLPVDPTALLSDEDKEQLDEDLARLARLRRDAETVSGNLKLA